MTIDYKSYILIIILSLFLISTGAVFIYYGNRIKKKEINKDDAKAGEFMMSIGIIGLLALLLISYYLGKSTFEKQFLKLALLLPIFFIFAACVVLIVYGFKINNDIITSNDAKAGEYIISLGSLSVIVGPIGLIYSSIMLFNLFKNKKKLNR